MTGKKLVVLALLSIFSCQKVKETSSVDVVLIGGGIMSATLGAMLHELDPNITIDLYERLDDIALESSSVWNNAGTGHASYCELNYTPPKPDGSIDITKAIQISEDFEVSKQLWAYFVKKGDFLKPSTFINTVPHISFVFGDENIKFLRKRYAALINHPLFLDMEYSEDPAIIAQWTPLVMKGRNQKEQVAATRMKLGVDVDFGSLTKGLIKGIKDSDRFHLFLSHDVVDIKRNSDQTWNVVVKDLKNHQEKSVKTKFIFIGAGGGTLHLLQKSGIKEIAGYGGFPVGGSWLVTHKKELVEQHKAKVYGKAEVGSPPMSVPHLDTRFINGQRALLFGPFATYSTKFLKDGSYFDWPLSLSFSNLWPMVSAGVKNIDLVGYLIGQVLMTKEQRMASLKVYMPLAHIDDWQQEIAGQRVQVIKKDKDKGGILQFGTELISSEDKSMVGLLGASPGASVAVSIMLDVLQSSFADQMKTNSWQEKIKAMIPSYGHKIAEDSKVLNKIREYTKKILQL